MFSYPNGLSSPRFPENEFLVPVSAAPDLVTYILLHRSVF